MVGVLSSQEKKQSNLEQPGTVYYYSPLNIYNHLGMVDHAHVYPGKEDCPKEHMFVHVYHEP